MDKKPVARLSDIDPVAFFAEMDMPLGFKPTKKAVKAVFDLVLGSIMENLDNGNKVELRDFGTFDRIIKPGRVGRNPMTGAAVSIPSASVLKFKPSASTKR